VEWHDPLDDVDLDKPVLLLDSAIHSGHTMLKATRALADIGAKEILTYLIWSTSCVVWASPTCTSPCSAPAATTTRCCGRASRAPTRVDDGRRQFERHGDLSDARQSRAVRTWRPAARAS